MYDDVSWMQQLLVHWLLLLHRAWHELSFETQTAPKGTPDPDWQHSDVDVHVPPGCWHVVPPLLLVLPPPLPLPLPLPASELTPLPLPDPPPELLLLMLSPPHWLEQLLLRHAMRSLPSFVQFPSDSLLSQVVEPAAVEL